MPRTDVDIRSLAYATDIDVLPDASIIEQRDGYVLVRTPTNPTYHWGNLLLYPSPPEPGAMVEWEAAYDAEFGARRESQHLTFGWDTVDGDIGAAAEFLAAGYELDVCAALVAHPDELRSHARASGDVTVQALDPADGADEELWAAVRDIQVAGREPGHSEAEYHTFVAGREADRRARFRAGDGAWFVARDGAGRVVASCGMIVTEGRGRYQAVDTIESHRRRGIASRLVHDVGRIAFDELGADQLVICADTDYHALPLYRSLGFVDREQASGVVWWPGAPHAERHPTRNAASRGA